MTCECRTWQAHAACGSVDATRDKSMPRAWLERQVLVAATSLRSARSTFLDVYMWPETTCHVIQIASHVIDTACSLDRFASDLTLRATCDLESRGVM